MFRSIKEAAFLFRTFLLALLTILLILAWGAAWPPAALAGPAPYPWVLNPHNLNYPRVRHTATILANGQVLVAGGDDGGSPATVLNEAELYDPHSGVWTLTGNLNTAREYHTATLLSNGQVLVAGGANGDGQCLASVEIYDPGPGTWTSMGALNTARAEHTATLLPNNKILFVGGRNDAGQALESAELYDPGTGTSQTITYHQARKNHTATLLPGGKVLVVGGYDASNQVLQSADIFDSDPRVMGFSSTNPCPYPHAGHSATFLPGGSVMVAGGDDGINGYSTNVDLYDPGTGTWTSTDPMTVPSDHQTATMLPDGRVMVAGGAPPEYADYGTIYDPNAPSGFKWNGGGMLLRKRSFHTAVILASGMVLLVGGQGDPDSAATAEFSYPATPQWTPSGNLQPRCHHTATLLPSGQVLVAGGYPDSSGSYLFATPTAQIYDPSTGAWSNTGSLITARGDQTATLLPGGLVLAAGGLNEDNPISMIYLNSAELYDPNRGAWRRSRPMGQARSSHTATLLADGRVLVAGGINDSGYLAGAELYNPATGIWSYTGSMSAPRAYHTATLLADGQILVAGGLNDSGYLAGAELYDPATGNWSDTGSMVLARAYHTATLLPDGRVLVAGGSFGDPNYMTRTDETELYDPISKTWTQTASMTVGRTRHTATLLPSGLVLVAGSDNDNMGITEFYDPASETWFLGSDMKFPRYSHTATLLNNGRVLAAGGLDAVNGPVALPSSELFNANMGVNESWRPVITSVQVNYSGPGSPVLGPRTTGSGTSLEISVGDLINDFMQQMQQAQGTQVQLMSVQSGQSMDLLIDTSQSTPAFLVTQGFNGANDVYQVTIVIGGIPSISFMIRIGSAVIPPCLSVTSCLQMLMN
jgi:Galactose oxidase, central domain/Kelch motif